MKKEDMSCIDCAVKNCNKMDKTYPDFCLTTHMDEEVLNEAMECYNEDDNRKVTIAAADTIHLKAVSAQDICQDTAFFQQSDTGCDPDLFRINLLCEIHDFFDTGMFAVILILYFSCSDRYFTVVILVVALHCFI